MVNALLGIKGNMTSTYDARGRRVGATVVKMEPNYVTQTKTVEGKDGYSSVQLGIGTKKSVKQPQIGHLKKAGIEQKVQFMREIRVEEVTENPGQQLKAWDVFSKGDAVKVTGTSKGRGFQGGVRRHGFHGGPKTHGQSDRHRAPGSIGAGTTPGRVYKGKRMAGHMGNETSSALNLEIVAIDRKTNEITIKGAIPGPAGALVTITRLGRIKGYTPPPEENIEEEEEGAEQAVEATVEQAPVQEEVQGEAVSEAPAEIEVVEQPADGQANQDAESKESN